jgi:hypothetical protein
MPVVSFVAIVNQRATLAGMADYFAWKLLCMYSGLWLARRLFGIRFDQGQNTDFRIFSVRQEKGQ